MALTQHNHCSEDCVLRLFIYKDVAHTWHTLRDRQDTQAPFSHSVSERSGHHGQTRSTSLRRRSSKRAGGSEWSRGTRLDPRGPRWSQVVPGGHERPRAAPHGDIHHSQLDYQYQAAVGGRLFCVTSMGGVRIASCPRYQVYVLYSTYNGRRACAPVHCSPDGVTAA